MTAMSSTLRENPISGIVKSRFWREKANTMSVEVNGIAHIQLTVNDPGRCIPFWERLCHFLEMKTLIKGEDVLYCIGSRTGILVRGAPPGNRRDSFDQDRSGLHHFCFRARAREDVDAIHAFIAAEPDARIVHGPEQGSRFAPGYYSVLFEDPDGIRVEVNYVPGKGHFGDEGRLGSQGAGPASQYGEDGLTDA
jgi:catechol 2,3-dioxygenase-like lactoylglutathione lyase family enzyme